MLTGTGGRRHEGAVAVVTGGASGIGYATAVRLAEEGAAVLACDINEEGLAALAQVARARGLEVRTLRADITSQHDVELVVQTARELGAITILANVAGIMDGFQPAHEVDDATWTRVMAVNVEGAFRLVRASLPEMLQHGTGAILNVGSIAGLRGGVAGLAYTTSKHALVGFTRSLAWMYAPQGVRCNIVMPGYVRTEIGASEDPQSDWGLDRARPILAQSVRKAHADEIASVAAWLLSQEASNVNGAILTADGGWTAG